ncbi:MAG TPA: class II D-tagatose-bisphosphate aldolase, non-catalytic subunit [Holophaga sp.]|nr:class II D-tagatose-bisphosphate aldolase, non-catalytic subunit [Holophaga sp.]
MPQRLLHLLEQRRNGKSRGIPSVRTAHPGALAAALGEARNRTLPLIVEATCSQVNHLGGYLGRTPEAHREFIHTLALQADMDPEDIILGGDHLGPASFRHGTPEEAMEKAALTVRAYVAAGFRKLHMDAARPCNGDGPDFGRETAARRVAALIRAAEEAYENAPLGGPPVYVLDAEPGTPPPAPGAQAPVTDPEAVLQAADLHRAAFEAEGIPDAWERVVAFRVKGGADFTEAVVHRYDPRRALPLARAFRGGPWLLEAAFTDYQSPGSLREMVEDGFNILQVGPWLTYAWREAVFALEDLARELTRLEGTSRIAVRDVLDRAMRRHPALWKDHHRGTPREQAYARLFSYFDRSRYYWTDPAVEREVEGLFLATEGPLPLQLLSLHLPLALEAVLDGHLEPTGRAIPPFAVRRVVANYFEACE